MRFAAVSDIHGNLPALEAVIADMAAKRVDAVVNLGDCLSGPLWPVETGERLIALGWPTLAGNHERQLLTLPQARMGRTDAATAVQLTEPIRAWLANLPSELAYAPDVLLCHGTPASDHRYWLHRGERGAMREATLQEIEQDALPVALALCGHTHLPRIATLDDGRIVANPGSVGLSAYEDDVPAYHVVETGSPRASYLIAETGSAGWQVQLHGVDYAFEDAARRAEEMTRPDWAHALRTGRVMR